MKRSNIIVMSVWAVCLVALAVFYATAYPAHLLWKEQNQIFLDTPSWIATYFDRPAWLGCLAGDWLTQFYHNPTVGAIILSIVISICTMVFAIVLRGAFSVKMREDATSHAFSQTCFSLTGGKMRPSVIVYSATALFAFYLIGCSLASATDLSFFVCIAGGLGLGLMKISLHGVLRPKPHPRAGLDLSPFLVLLSYWLFGFGALLTAAAIILRTWRRPVVIICATILAFGFPAVLCGHYALPYGKALLYPGIATPTLPQWHSEDRIAVADAFHRRDYERTKQLAKAVDNPDDITAFYYHLASAMQDSLPDNLLKYPVRNLGTLTTIGENTPLAVINMMNDLYYELGDMTYAERAAMMRNVFSPRNRNVRMMQRLAETNLVSGDTLAAMKYLRILGKTHAYSGWASEHTPGHMTADAEADIMYRRRFSNAKDNIRLGDNCRNIILELLESNPDNTTALDYLLCTDLLLKDMDTFKMDYDTYCMDKGDPRYKDLYQQALMIYLAGTDAPQEDWERYIVSQPMMERFNAYSSQRGNPAFSDTYWYYFDREL